MSSLVSRSGMIWCLMIDLILTSKWYFPPHLPQVSHINGWLNLMWTNADYVQTQDYWNLNKHSTDVLIFRKTTFKTWINTQMGESVLNTWLVIWACCIISHLSILDCGRAPIWWLSEMLPSLIILAAVVGRSVSSLMLQYWWFSPTHPRPL